MSRSRADRRGKMNDFVGRRCNFPRSMLPFPPWIHPEKATEIKPRIVLSSRFPICLSICLLCGFSAVDSAVVLAWGTNRDRSVFAAVCAWGYRGPVWQNSDTHVQLLHQLLLVVADLGAGKEKEINSCCMLQKSAFMLHHCQRETAQISLRESWTQRWKFRFSCQSSAPVND